MVAMCVLIFKNSKHLIIYTLMKHLTKDEEKYQHPFEMQLELNNFPCLIRS